MITALSFYLQSDHCGISSHAKNKATFFHSKKANVFMPIYTHTKKRDIKKKIFFDQYMEKY